MRRVPRIKLAWYKAAFLLCLGAALLVSDSSSVIGLRSFAAKRFLGLASGGRRLALTDYELIGDGFYCENPPTSNLNGGGVVVGGTGGNAIDECAALCDANLACNAFEAPKDGNAGDCVLFSASTPDTLSADIINDYSCYAKITWMDVYRAGAVYGDPLFTGLKGQVFKFEGRSDAWYANLASPSLQWNLEFHQFDQCPKGKDMFVTSIGISLLDRFGEIAKSILVVAKQDKQAPNLPACKEGVCLAHGNLAIDIGGEIIAKPGDYNFPLDGIRIIAHNTYGACSRKYYDYKEDAGTEENLKGSANGNSRRLATAEERPIDFLLRSKGMMLDPAGCDAWIKERVKQDDLFQQEGNWSTIYIITPLISFHLELRQNEKANDESCAYSSLDTWISRVKKTLQAEEWRGIIGETREVKVGENGESILSNRTALLDYGKDEAYEVQGPFAKDFIARIPRSARVPRLGTDGDQPSSPSRL